MAREQASIGSAQHYGPKFTNEGLPDTVSTYGLVKQLEIYIDFAEANAGLPVEDADTDAGTLTLPANSFIKAAYLQVGTAWTSTGSAVLNIGTQTVAGATINAVNIDTLAKSVLTANAWLVLDGALVGATVGTAESQISIDDATEVFNAGTGRLIIEYIESTVE